MTLMYSDNGGASWESAEIPTTENLTRLKWLQSDMLLVATESGQILRSFDMGESFISLDSSSMIQRFLRALIWPLIDYGYRDEYRIINGIPVPILLFGWKSRRKQFIQWLAIHLVGYLR